MIELTINEIRRLFDGVLLDETIPVASRIVHQ
jgi:hypothetical protein